jgi:hypothetical protein
LGAAGTREGGDGNDQDLPRDLPVGVGQRTKEADQTRLRMRGTSRSPRTSARKVWPDLR